MRRIHEHIAQIELSDGRITRDRRNGGRGQYLARTHTKPSQRSGLTLHGTEGDDEVGHGRVHGGVNVRVVDGVRGPEDGESCVREGGGW